MTNPMRLALAGLAFGVAVSYSPKVLAIELLTAGDFESTVGGGEVPGWTLSELITGTTTQRNAAALVGFADNPIDPLNPNPADRGLWLQAFNGDPDPGLVDAILEQIVPGTPGETYSFSGQALFETNYSGGVAFLDPLSPWGAIESPTETLFELAFLDAGGSVIGAPMVRDVATETFNGFGYTAISALTDVAPAGTASVRVRAMGLSMADAGLNPQSAFVDNFSLTTSSAPSTELLTNANLNISPPTLEDVLSAYFEFVESPDTADTLQLAGFANDPATGGANGIWVRPFVTDADDTAVRQTVEGTAGVEYTFAASSRFEAAFLFEQTETLLELAFLDEGGEVIDSTTLDLVNGEGQTADNMWHRYSVSATAPEGTVSVRVAGILNNLMNNEAGGAQSAFWDDFSLMAVVDPGLPGDANGDGKVDLLDLDILGANFGLTGGATVSQGDFNGDGNVDLLDLDVLGSNFGAMAGMAVAVPEPTGVAIVAVGLIGAAARRRR